MTNYQTGKGEPDSKAWVRRVILFCGILLSGGSLLFPRSLLAAIVVLLALLNFNVVSSKLKRRNLPIYVWLLFVMLVIVIHFQAADIEVIITRVVNFYLALVLLNIYCRADSCHLVGDLMFLLRPMAYQSILTVALAFLLPLLFLPINIAGAEYRTFLLLLTYHSTIDGGGPLVRPDGFFFEPGVFQIYLNIYLFLVAALHRSIKELAPAIIAVFLTQSTTGLLIAVLILGVYSYQFIRRNSPLRRLTFTFFAVALAVPIYSVIQDNVNKKLFGALSGSSMARQYDLLTGLNVIRENPLLGIGFSKVEYFREADRLGASVEGLSNNDQDGRSTSNGLINLFYSIGIPLGLMLFVGLYRQHFFGQRWVFGAILSISLLGEALVFTPMFLMFAFSGLSKR